MIDVEQYLSSGFVYYSFGRDFLDETFVSIGTLLAHNRGAKVCVITDEDGQGYIKQAYSDVALDQVKRVDINKDQGIWEFRLRLDKLSPYDKTIYLDGDTYILAEIQDLFDLVDTFDFVAVPDESHPARGFILGLKGGYRALNYYNCGFFIFRKSEATRQLFENWHREYTGLHPLEPGDQGPLVRALIKTNIRFMTLPKEYNLRLINKCASFQGRVKVIHGRARDPEKLIKMINDIDLIDRGSRVWIPHLQKVIKAVQFRPYYRILKIFNLDNVQEGAHRKENKKNLYQKLRPYAQKKIDAVKMALTSALFLIKGLLKYVLVLLKVSKPVQQGGFVTSVFYPHLGGNIKGGDPGTFDDALFNYLLEDLKISSFFDCGCGEGHVAKYFEDRFIRTLALDGFSQEFVCKNAIVHDMTKGPYISGTTFDLVWCCEVAEHIERRYAGNLVQTVAKNASNLILMTHGIPGQGGHHHVNLQPECYWTQLITDQGFYFNPYLTLKLRELSRGKYFKRCGLAFEKNR